MPKPNNRDTAYENERLCLCLLYDFGWLRSADLTALWPGTVAGARRMVQRTLRRLVEQRAVLTARLPNGVPVYALAQRGAERLRGLNAATFADARSGADLLRQLAPGGEWQHRCLCNELIIWGMLATAGSDYNVTWYSERAVLAGRTPGGWGQAQFLHRRADGLAVVDDAEVLWLEVERSNKPSRSHRRLMEAIRATADELTHAGLHFTNVVLAATEERYLRRVRDQLAREAEHDHRARDAAVCYLLHQGHADFEPWPEGAMLPWEFTHFGTLLQSVTEHNAKWDALMTEVRPEEGTDECNPQAVAADASGIEDRQAAEANDEDKAADGLLPAKRWDWRRIFS